MSVRGFMQAYNDFWITYINDSCYLSNNRSIFSFCFSYICGNKYSKRDIFKNHLVRTWTLILSQNIIDLDQWFSVFLVQCPSKYLFECQ